MKWDGRNNNISPSAHMFSVIGRKLSIYTIKNLLELLQKLPPTIVNRPGVAGAVLQTPL